MKIKKLTATFGNLNAATLELEDGMNIFTMPNESGKSTWGAFIIAMFYGVDSSERDTTTRLADKNRYRPWNGAPAAGVMELDIDGLPMTIERWSTGRGILNRFEAKNSNTGEPVPGLTGENCGLQILGMPRSVFERSAYIRQSGAVFDHDNDLERKLLSLVTTGEEGVSYSEAEGKLSQSLRRLRYNRSGELPVAEGALAAAEAKLEKLKFYNQKNVEQAGRIEQLNIDKAECEGQLDAVRMFEESEARRRFNESQTRLESQQASAAQLESSLGSLRKIPTSKEIGALLRGLDVLDELEANVAKEREQLLKPAKTPEYAGCPALSGQSADGARQSARAQAEQGKRFKLLSKLHRILPIILCVISVITLLTGCILSLSGRLTYGDPVIIGAAALALITAAYYMGFARQGRSKNEEYLAHLLASYGVSELAGIDSKVDEYVVYLTQVDTLSGTAEANRARAEELTADLEGKRGELYKRIGAILPVVGDSSSARVELEGIAEIVSELEGAKASEASSKQVRDALAPTVSDLEPAPVSEALFTDPGYDKRALQETLRRITKELSIQLSTSAENRGELKAIGDPAALAAEKQRLMQNIEKHEREYRAIELALEALKEANDGLQNRFSPAINERAGEIMSHLTGGRYSGLVFDRAMGISATSVDDILSHDTRSFSKGTVDQLYLAVRLAICDLTLPTDNPTPLIFDDAFSSFDDTRLKTALDWLRLESAWRQTIVFSCQEREEIIADNR